MNNGIPWNSAATAFRDVALPDSFYKPVVVYDGTLRGCAEVLAMVSPAERSGVYVSMVDSEDTSFRGEELEMLIRKVAAG